MMDETATTKDACLAYLEAEISSADEDSPTYEIGTLLKGFLVDGALDASETAQRIDSYYANQYVPADPLRRFVEDKGITGYLGLLWGPVSNMARLLPYNDARQDKVIQLMRELRKIERPARIWKEDCQAYQDPVYAMMMDDEWNGLYVYDDQEEQDEAIEGPVKQRCEEWVNFSAFMARAIEAGFNDGGESGYKYPLIDIKEFVETTVPPGPIRNTRIQVAIQYILLAGRSIYREFVEKYAEDEWCRERWRTWIAKFKEVAEGEEEDPELRAGALQACQIMMELDSKRVTMDPENGQGSRA